MSFAFTNGSLTNGSSTNGSSTNGSSTNGSPLSISSSVIKSYKDPYDAYKNKLNNQQQLFLIINGVIVEHLDPKIISVRWAIACAKRVLPIFEKWNLDDKRPRRAIEAAELWVLQYTDTTAAYTAANNAANSANAAYYAASAFDAAAFNAASDAANAADYAAYAAATAATAAAYAAHAASYDAAFHAANAASAVAFNAATAHAASTNVKVMTNNGSSRNTEIQWQRSQLRKIIKEHCKYYKKLNKLLCQRYPPELSSLIISNIF